MSNKKIFVGARFPVEDWEQIKQKIDKKTDADILRELVYKELDSGTPKTMPKTRGGLTLDDIDPVLLYKFVSQRMETSKTPEENLQYIMNNGYDPEEARAILALFYDKFSPNWKPKIDETAVKPPKKVLKKQLTSGVIEYFHRRYREFKAQNQELGMIDQEPQHHVVREWLVMNGVHKRVADRWAGELMEKYRPNINPDAF